MQEQSTNNPNIESVEYSKKNIGPVFSSFINQTSYL